MDLVLIVATVIVAGLIFSLLVRVMRAALSTLITLGLVLLALQFLFGISFNDIWQEMAQLWRSLEQAIA